MANEPPQALSAAESRYAVVVVNAVISRRISSVTAEDTDANIEEEGHLARAFHYLIVPGMQVLPGQLVWVPFQTRTLQGIVISLDTDAPVENVRPLLRIADPIPVLDANRLDLARWMSSYYLAPLQQVIAAMLPPGVLQPIETVVRPAELPKGAEFTPQQQQLYSLIQDQTALTLSRLQRLRPLPNWRNILEQLVRRGWVTRTSEALPPSIRPKTASFIHIALMPPTGVKPGSRSEAALRYLQQRPTDWIRLDQAIEETGLAAAVFRNLASRGMVELEQRQVWRDPLQGQAFLAQTLPKLTPEQDQVWAQIAQDLDYPQAKPYLLQGVTCSGKTEIYLRAVERTLQQGRGAIVLVPEISLTPQTIRRFGSRFGNTLAVSHSGLSAGERYDQWRRIRAGELKLVVGARSALFAPVARLGLVVLDEEHEWTYKQESMPRYHARDAAVELTRLSGATCILGSATPSLESAYQAELGAYHHIRLPNRILTSREYIQQDMAGNACDTGVYHEVNGQLTTLAADLPPVHIVDMRTELKEGNTHMFSRALQQALTQVLANRQQAILFLNRRGSATFILCRDCGYVLKCPRCDRPLTYHDAQTSLICHQCGYRRANVAVCPNCQSKRIRYFGVGTERVEEAARDLYPQAHIVRWDQDTTATKGQHEHILDQFIRGEADVMVGTQMVAKGLDLPRVTLVGVVSADTMLQLPDLRAGERTFQLLTQVAGRAGRSALGGQVIIQTYNPEHPAIQAASKHDVDGFYAHEMSFRREQWYPPYSHLVALRYLHPSQVAAQVEAEAFAEQLRQRRARLGLPELDVIGPTPCYYAQIKGRYRWQILLRGTDPAVLVRNIFLPIGWQVDVDPMSLL
ncbi:MAG: primosomal protein N' [Chloroflexi bacterium]|nr:primosomal protein N' [Chloroflexota bacterium]